MDEIEENLEKFCYKLLLILHQVYFDELLCHRKLELQYFCIETF